MTSTKFGLCRLGVWINATTKTHIGSKFNQERDHVKKVTNMSPFPNNKNLRSNHAAWKKHATWWWEKTKTKNGARVHYHVGRSYMWVESMPDTFKADRLTLFSLQFASCWAGFKFMPCDLLWQRERERGLWGFHSSALPFILSWGVWNFNKSWWWKVKLKRVTNRQKRKSEGGGKTEGCVVWGKKRSEGRQKYAVSARVAYLTCALCPVGFVASSLCTCCGFT